MSIRLLGDNNEKFLLIFVLIVSFAFSFSTELLAKGGGSHGGGKGGRYNGGKGSSHKGGQYIPPYGRRYNK